MEDNNLAFRSRLIAFPSPNRQNLLVERVPEGTRKAYVKLSPSTIEIKLSAERFSGPCRRNLLAYGRRHKMTVRTCWFREWRKRATVDSSLRGRRSGTARTARKKPATSLGMTICCMGCLGCVLRTAPPKYGGSIGWSTCREQEREVLHFVQNDRDYGFLLGRVIAVSGELLVRHGSNSLRGMNIPRMRRIGGSRWMAMFHCGTTARLLGTANGCFQAE
jgi:hypothetical protein